MAAAPAPGVTAQDQQFLRRAHEWHLAEIAAGRFAQRKATEQATKRLAARWIADHTRLDNALRPVARQLRVDLPDVASAAQRAVLYRYQRASGPSFDGLWISTQRQAHTEGRLLVEAELTRGSAAQVKQLARQTSPVVTEHTRLLDQAAPDLGAAPGRVDAGRGVSAGSRPTVAAGLFVLGLALVGVSGWTLWSRRPGVAAAGPFPRGRRRSRRRGQ